MVAPFHRVEELVAAEADLALLDRLNDGTRNVLMVGRVSPNKGHVELVDAFAAYLDGYGDPARLIVVGKRDPRLQGYSDEIAQRKRFAAVGRTQMQLGWMMVIRAIFNPQRIKLPEDQP